MPIEEVSRAQQFIEDTIGLSLGVQLKHSDKDGPHPASLKDEVFLCHSDDWWYRRARSSTDKVSDLNLVKRLGDVLPGSSSDAASSSVEDAETIPDKS